MNPHGPHPVIISVPHLLDSWPDLGASVLIGMDLRGEVLDWRAAIVDSTVLLGCLLPPGVSDELVGRGAVVLSGFDDLPFQPYRADLYTYDELITVDQRIGDWFTNSSTALRDSVARALHDATIDAAVARYVVGRRIVGVMGGHAIERGSDLYRAVARLGRTLTRNGYTVATGGGPGVMEAANLGAWMATAVDDELERALATLARAPAPAEDADGYVQAAVDVRTRWPNGGDSLGVPTWVYIDEPTSGFATRIAKYFTNSIREDGLLAIARSGVVYAPGGAGTQQEIFTDTAQNSLTLQKVRSPMVFFGRDFFETENADLLAAARRQAAAFGWNELVAVADSPDEAIAFIEQHDPDASGRAGIERRRYHENS